MLSGSENIQRLETHLRALTGPRDPFLGAGRHQFAQHYIRQVLSAWGDVHPHRFAFQGQTFVNWQLTLDGQQPQLPPILVGAHYDTVPGSPGADDNASGLAVLLLLAELMATAQSESSQPEPPQSASSQSEPATAQPAPVPPDLSGASSPQPSPPGGEKRFSGGVLKHRPGPRRLSPRRTIHFVAFDLEEYGLLGSAAFAQRWRQQQRSLHLMLSLEMLGYFTDAPQAYPVDVLGKFYPAQGNFIALVGNASAALKMNAMKRAIAQAGTPCSWLPVVNKGRLMPSTRRSDHAPFWDAGYSAVMVTDTADLRNPHYHQPSDQLETLDIERMANIAVGLAGSLSRM